MAELGSIALSYAAGALSTLSPCVLPLLPIILLGALEQHAWGPVALAAGLSASFAGVGIFLVSLGYSLGVDPTAFRLGVAAHRHRSLGSSASEPVCARRRAGHRGRSSADRATSAIPDWWPIRVGHAARSDMVTVLGSDTGRGRRARRPERNCRPGGHGHGHVQPRSCDANLGARLRLATSDHCPTRFLGSHVADRQAAHRRHPR